MTDDVDREYCEKPCNTGNSKSDCVNPCERSAGHDGPCGCWYVLETEEEASSG